VAALAALTIGFIVIATLVFAAVSVSSLALWAFPIVVSIWTAFLWIFIGRGIAVLSTPPHRPRRIVGIVIACSLVAIAALAVSILIGLVLIGPRANDL
jgi:hypothetical protein